MQVSLCSLVSDAALERLALLPHLRCLNISKCRDVTDAGLRALRASSQLQRLDMQNLPGVTDQGVRSLTGLPRLRHLALSRPDPGAEERLVYYRRESVGELQRARPDVHVSQQMGEVCGKMWGILYYH